MIKLSTENERPKSPNSPKSPKKLSPSKRLCNNQIPKKLIEEQNVQANSCIRDDTVFRYYGDTDTLSVYFAKASSGVVSYSEEANNDILISYDHDDKIVSVEIFGASRLLHCHLFDTPMNVDDKPPLSLYPVLYGDSDELKVYLVDSSIPSTTFQKTEDDDFEVGIDDAKKIIVLLFHNASSRIAKTLSEEERDKLAKEAKLRSLEIAKWTYLLDKNLSK